MGNGVRTPLCTDVKSAKDRCINSVKEGGGISASYECEICCWLDRRFWILLCKTVYISFRPKGSNFVLRETVEIVSLPSRSACATGPIPEPHQSRANPTQILQQVQCSVSAQIQSVSPGASQPPSPLASQKKRLQFAGRWRRSCRTLTWLRWAAMRAILMFY